MKGKCYDQVPYCPMAHALSLVGERWSLLIVRELLHGPRRYTDLANGLPGIGTNILAARLKDLETFGVVEKKKLPPPYASTVYELTPYGARARRGAVRARALGRPLARPARLRRRALSRVGPERAAGAIRPGAARGLTETYVLKIGDDAFTARVVDGDLDARPGARRGRRPGRGARHGHVLLAGERRAAPVRGAGARPREDRGPRGSAGALLPGVPHGAAHAAAAVA